MDHQADRSKESYRKADESLQDFAEESLQDFVGLSPTDLARSLNLKRANARAQVYHKLESRVHPLWSCKSIDALYVMSQMKEECGLDRTQSRREKNKTLLRLFIEDSMDSNGKVEFEDRPKGKGIDDVSIGGTIRKVMGGRRSRRVYGATSFSACLPSHITSEPVKEGMALVKYSYNPYMDFRDSMMQMIVDTNMDINDSDLEELLFCYFSMNSPELHDLIERAFTDIWIEVQAAILIERFYHNPYAECNIQRIF